MDTEEDVVNIHKLPVKSMLRRGYQLIAQMITYVTKPVDRGGQEVII